MSGGRATLRLPFPDIRTWSWYKGERTYRDFSRGTDGQQPWKRLVRFCRTLKNTGAHYDVQYRFLCGKAWAIVRWSTQ